VDVSSAGGPTAAALTDAANATLLGGSEYEYDNSTLEFDDADGHNGTDDESPFDNPVTPLNPNCQPVF
jgi:hypothetical protein